MGRKRKPASWKEKCLEDKSSIVVLILNTLAFASIATGFIIYFQQYSFRNDKSDEKWIYPFIWSIPCFGWVLGFLIFASGILKFQRCLCILPGLGVMLMLLLLFLCFEFFEAIQDPQKQTICDQNSSTQDIECVVTKDGGQICGHVQIRKLCREMDLGFYFIFLGCVLMVGTQILFITTGCLRRAQIIEEASPPKYFELRGNLLED